MNSIPIPINAPLTTRPGALDNAVANLCEVFGRGSLVAVPRGVAPDAAPVPLLTESNSPEYLRRLAASSIAVNLGGHPGLAAIRFADRSSLDEFLARNSSCAETLVTAHAAGVVVWIRAVTAYRAPLVLPGLSVLMAGSLLVYDRTALHCRDEFLNITTIKPIELSAINWGPDPDDRIAAWLASLDHGEFFRRGGRGQMIPNTQAWRAFLASRLKPTTAFDTRERQFYHRADGDDWHPLTDDHLRDELSRLVHAAPVGTSEARARLTDEWLIRLCGRLKSSLAAQLQIIEDHLRVYMEQRLIEEPGANATNAELFADFDAHCKQAGQRSLSPTKFKVLIGQVLRGESWRVGYSKSLKRPGGQQNGWRGLRLRDQSIPPMTSDGAAGALGAEI